MITFDYQNALDFIGGEEAVARMEPQVKAASDMLHKKKLLVAHSGTTLPRATSYHQ